MTARKTHQIKYESEAAAHSALIEFIIYVCFMIITIIVATSSRSLSMYFFNRSIEYLFLSREINTTTHEQSIRFADLATTYDVWAFLETKFIPDLHGAQENINGQSLPPPAPAERRKRAAEDKLIFLEQNLVMGPPRLRQLRVKGATCDVHDVFGRYFTTCYAEYSSSDEDTSNDYKGTHYKTLAELGAYSVWGELHTYRSGGFVKNLTYNYDDNKKIITELKKNKWLDRASRFIIFEFTLFNANENLVNNVKFYAELPSTGGVVTSYSIQSASLDSIFWKGGVFVFAAGVIFYLFIIYYTVVEILEVIAFGILNYVRMLWNFVDFMIILLAFLTLIYNIWHPIYVNTLYKTFEEKPDEFLELDVLCFWNLMYRDIMAICAFLVCIKIFKFISFNKTMRQFNATVSACIRDLLGFSVMFGIVFLAYALLGLLLFGNVHYDFRNFHESLLTMIRMILGDFNYEGLEAANRVLGPIYFLTYTLLVFFILLNMFLAIINDTYSAVKSEVKGGRNYLSLYLRKLLNKFCPRCCPLKPAKEEKSATPARSETGSPARKDNVIDFFEPTSRGEQNTDPAAISRLTSRVAALEDVIEQLVSDVDRTMRKVAPRRRRRVFAGGGGGRGEES